MSRNSAGMIPPAGAASPIEISASRDGSAWGTTPAASPGLVRDLGAAFGLFATVFGLRLALQPWLEDDFVFMFFLPVIAIAAARRGRRCGLLATLFSAVAIAFVWLPEAWTFQLRDLDIAFHLAAFVFLALLLTQLLGRGRDALLALEATAAREIQAQRELRAANAALERQVAELKRTGAALREAQQELSEANASLEQRVQERTAAQAALAAEMETFAYTVSHDLRAPLRTVTGFAEALREDHAANLSAEAQDLIDRIVRGGARMDRLITDLLAYSRVNRQAVQLGPVSVADCLRQLIQSAPEIQPPRANIQIIEPLPVVLAAEPLLRQALANLLGNAVKFMPAGRTPEISIRAEQLGDAARLWICDNGIGIRPEFQPRLFRLFERLDAGRDYEGTGMGLAIVRRAMGRMDGTVGVESDGQGGCRAWLQLKVAEAVVPATTPTSVLAAAV